MTDAHEPLNPQVFGNLFSPSNSLEDLVNNNIQFSPNISCTPTSTAASQLHALIQAERFPPGQRARFEEIDALRSELSVEDVMTCLQTALGLLRESLAKAVKHPSKITEQAHLRTKLREEYHALPEEVAFGVLSMEAMMARLKEWVGRRWAIKAMSAQG